MLFSFRVRLASLIALGFAGWAMGQDAALPRSLQPPPAQPSTPRASPAPDPQTGPLIERFVARGRVRSEIAIIDPMQSRSDVEDGNGAPCRFRLRTYEDGFDTIVELLHDSPTSGRLWVDEAIRLNLGSDGASHAEDRLPAPGADVTGDGLPDLVLETNTGGTHCCNELVILQLRPMFREVQRIATQDEEAAFRQLDADPDLEITFGDPVFHSFHAGNADSAAPRVVLKWTQGMYLPDTNLMRKPPLPKAELDRLVDSLLQEGTRSTHSPPAPFTAQLADLVYAGNADQAWWLADKAWPPSLKDREGYLREFRERLWRSEFRDALCRLNPGLEKVLAKDGFRPVPARRGETLAVVSPDPALFSGKGPMVMQRVINIEGADEIEPAQGAREDQPFIARLFDDRGTGSFEVVQGDRRLVAVRGERMRIMDAIPPRGGEIDWFAPSLGEDPHPGEAPATDLDGDGFPELVVAEYTGGANCCFLLHVVRLQPEVRYQCLHSEHAQRSPFCQLDDDPAIELAMPDWTMSMWNCGHARAPLPTVVMDFDGNGWRPSPRLMRRPPASEAELREMAARWKGWRCEAGGAWKAPEGEPNARMPWASMLDLIYSGNASQARWVLDQGYSESPEKRQEFWHDLLQQLAQSESWDALVELNGDSLKG